MSWNKEHQQCIICLSSFSWWMWNHAQPPSFSILEMLLWCSVSLQIMNVLQWLMFPKRFKSHLNHFFALFFPFAGEDVVGISHSSGYSIIHSVASLFRLNLHITTCMFWYWRNCALRIWLDLNFSRSGASIAGKLWQIDQLKHCWTQVHIILKAGDVSGGLPSLIQNGLLYCMPLRESEMKELVVVCCQRQKQQYFWTLLDCLLDTAMKRKQREDESTKNTTLET